MPFRLPKAIRAIAAATNSDEVLSALQKTTNLNVLAVWPLQLDQVNATDILYHQDIPQKFRQDHQAAIGQFGLSPIVRQAITSPVPFTFSEVRQTLQPRGEEHWIFDLLQDHGFKDGFHCNYGPWIVGFWSDRMLGSRVVLSPEGRMTLNASGAVAIHRLKELMQKRPLLTIPESAHAGNDGGEH